MNKIIDITPNYKFTSSRDKVIDNPILDMGTTISGVVGDRLVSTVNSAINQAGNLVTDVVNVRLDTSSKKILSDFTFGVVDYAGAVKTGDIAWNSVTGAITGGSGVVVYRKGIVGASAGVVTFSIDATTGDATFAGTLAAAAGTLGTITAGTLTGLTINTGASGNRIAISSSIGLGSLAGLNFYNQDGTSIATLNATNSTILFDATSPNTASRMFQFIQFIQNGSNLNPMVYLEAKDVSTGTTLLSLVQKGDLSAQTIDLATTSIGNGLVITHLGDGICGDFYLNNASANNYAVRVRSTATAISALYAEHSVNTMAPAEFRQTGAVVANTHNYYRVLKLNGGGITKHIWISDGFSPNTDALSGGLGDICMNCDSGKAYYNNGAGWTAM